MSDNKQHNDSRDNSKVDLQDPSEVEYVHSKYPHMQHSQVVDAIEKHGPSRADIYAHLDRLTSNIDKELLKN